MRTFDWLVVIVMGVVGWLVVSFLLNRGKPQGDDAADRGARPDENADAEFPTMPRLPGSIPSSVSVVPPTAVNTAELLSLDEIGRSWQGILGVSVDASGAEIEAAYHARLGECDGVRFDSNADPANRLRAEQRRAQVNQAYEFIRPTRG